MSLRGTLLSNPTDDQLPIYARSGWKIPTEQAPFNLTVEALRIKVDVRMREWTRGLELRSLSAFPYNCVGMIFAARRAIIDIIHIFRLLDEDGYREIRVDSAKLGDIVLYLDQTGEPTHVALIISIDRIGQTPSIRVMSKWGLEAEYLHFMENVPADYGRPTRFYTERVS